MPKVGAGADGGEMSDFKGSFLGFTYDDIHSSDLGIVRVSDGSRYNENLLPDIQDKTAIAPGTDGTYFYGSTKTRKSFNLNIAFEGVTETQIRQIKQLFGAPGLHRLCFDETPYKYYVVKVSSSPVFKYLPFNAPDLDNYSTSVETKGQLYGQDTIDFVSNPPFVASRDRIYKGEGTLQFVAYYPYAYSVFKYSDQYDPTEYVAYNYSQSYNVPEIYEWIDSLNLHTSDYEGTYGGNTYVIDTPTFSTVNGKCLVYNPGDLDTPFMVEIKNTSAGATLPGVTLTLGAKTIQWSSFTLDATDYGVRYNSKLHLLEGVNASGAITGKVYNKYIVAGDFFDIPTSLQDQYLIITLTSSLGGNNTFTVNYNYLYY